MRLLEIDFLVTHGFGSDRVTQLVNALANKPEDPSSVPEIHMVEGETYHHSKTFTYNIKNTFLAGRWSHMPLMPALGRQRQLECFLSRVMKSHDLPIWGTKTVRFIFLQ